MSEPNADDFGKANPIEKARQQPDKVRMVLDKMATEHAGTPWAVLAKRDKLTALGLEWQPATVP